jgi:hypothetical protein
MTLPDERYRAVINTEKFLQDLLDPKKTPRVPKDIRKQAYWCLRHYPSKYHMDIVATVVPTVFQTNNKIDEVSLLIHGYEERKNARTMD